MSKAKQIPVERVHEHFYYDHELGALRVREADEYKNKGDIARIRNNTKTKYHVVFMDNKAYSEHRVIWVYFNNKQPEGVIDHINGDIHDNRIENLRDIDDYHNQLRHRRSTVRLAKRLSKLYGATKQQEQRIVEKAIQLHKRIVREEG